LPHKAAKIHSLSPACQTLADLIERNPKSHITPHAAKRYVDAVRGRSDADQQPHVAGIQVHPERTLERRFRNALLDDV
jgi:hypothetical protein